MKIYTKTGDRGKTSLMGGSRVAKNSLRIAASGDVDELNAALGICRSLIRQAYVKSLIKSLQQKLFVLGADVSAPPGIKYPGKRIQGIDVRQMEVLIDGISAKMAPLRHFIFPSGSVAATHFHLARAICRRAERSLVALKKKETVRPDVLKFINRLSDLLFVIARFSNFLEKVPEEKWTGD